MNSLFELAIIIFCGLASAAFLGWYFFNSSRHQKCRGCAFYMAVKKTGPDSKKNLNNENIKKKEKNEIQKEKNR